MEKKSVLEFGIWNIKALNNKRHEVTKELGENNIDICVLQKRKKGKSRILSKIMLLLCRYNLGSKKK